MVAVEAVGNPTSSSPIGAGGSVAGLQIPSMAYPPSSPVSHFKRIMFLFNLNDWLIGDGAFFIIRRTISLSNKKEKEKRLSRSVALSNDVWVGL